MQPGCSTWCAPAPTDGERGFLDSVRPESYNWVSQDSFAGWYTNGLSNTLKDDVSMVKNKIQLRLTVNEDSWTSRDPK